MTNSLQDRGRRVASLLAGAWRCTPPLCTLDVECFSDLAPHVIKTGAGALAWWKLRDHATCDRPEVRELRSTYDLHKLEAFMQQVRLQQTVEQLRAYGIEPLLSKGWSVAQLYPEIGLRPYGDFDLHIDPCRTEDACRALETLGPAQSWVDLHESVPELPERSLAALQQRAQRLPLLATHVHTLSAEDQLRQLCLHFARHGGWRPLWLCDVGMFLESLPADFDWDYCTTGDSRRTAWMQAVLGLAVRLLDVRRDAVPDTIARQQSGWLDEVILGEWGGSEPGDSHSRDKTAMLRRLAQPLQVWKALRRRIPNALEAAYHHQTDPESPPPIRWHRLRHCWSRTLRFACRLPLLWLSRTPTKGRVHHSQATMRGN